MHDKKALTTRGRVWFTQYYLTQMKIFCQNRYEKIECLVLGIINYIYESGETCHVFSTIRVSLILKIDVARLTVNQEYKLIKLITRNV